MKKREKDLEERINATRSRHDKAWGYEDWIVNNNDAGYCGKILVINTSHQCSMHLHKVKSEVFYVNNGLVLVQAYKKERVMWPRQSLEIVPGTWHRFIGLTDAEIIEFSSYHREEDSYRNKKLISGKVPGDEWTAYTKKYKKDIDLYWAQFSGSFGFC